ncbi:hypothetical protein B5M10_10930 [Pluralibacter gergoviae]|uniref:hypothetical protein n=1 Tax=Pluralibacter gergoviae TaxID=61647 RepID=UPI0005ECE820|nr:hypothetical protein [Pluralibacter gergoviae]KJM66320.1 hypothetical protein SS31_03165 [Pluralibacter gergoviae]OUR01099.1 hypothetical protein B5M10_10930 [Pluralibacter gergoviae]
MTHLVRNYSEWLQKVIGKKLSLVEALVYIFDEPELQHPQQLQLTFSGISSAEIFKCGKDGVSLELIDVPMQEKDLGEYGKEVIMDMSLSISFINYIDKTLSDVVLIFSQVENAYIGVRLTFEEQLDLIIINLGDEINILESLPLPYEKDEGIIYKDI